MINKAFSNNNKALLKQKQLNRLKIIKNKNLKIYLKKMIRTFKETFLIIRLTNNLL